MNESESQTQPQKIYGMSPRLHATIITVSTIAVAVLLSLGGYIPFDAITAAIGGAAFSVIYIIYISYYWSRVRRRVNYNKSQISGEPAVY